MTEIESRERKLAQLPPFVPSNLRREGSYCVSYDLPETWPAPQRHAAGVRVFEALLPAGLAEALVFAGEAARAHSLERVSVRTGPRSEVLRPRLAIAAFGVRFAIVIDGRVVATARNPTAEDLEKAIDNAEERDTDRRIFELELAHARTMPEEATALDLLREAGGAPADDSPDYVEGLLNARRWILCGLARVEAPTLLRLVEEELARLSLGYRVWTSPSGTLVVSQVGSPHPQAAAPIGSEALPKMPGTKLEPGQAVVWIPGNETEPGHVRPAQPDEMPIGRVARIMPLPPARFPSDLCPDCGELVAECMCSRDVGAGSEREA